MVMTRPQPEVSPVEAADRFEALFRRHYADLYRLTYRLLGDRVAAEDTVQEAFLRLAASPVVARPEAEVGAWLRRVGLSLAANRLRDDGRQRARLERAARLEPAEASEDGDPARSVLRDETRAEVRAALAALPPRQRDCLLLRHSGYAYAEIAATLDVAVGSVGVLLARAERAFRQQLQERHDAMP